MYFCNMRIFQWAEISPGGEDLHVQYTSQLESRGWQPHGHDFYEVFWIDSGAGWHWVQGIERPRRLATGQMCFIRAHDCHGFEAEASAEPFSVINLAFATPAWKELQQRYQLAEHPFFNDSAQEPPVLEIAGSLHGEFAAYFRQWIGKARTALHRDAFVLGLASKTASIDSGPHLEMAPAWLRRGLMAFGNAPSLWAGGTGALARECGCSPTHLARVMVKTLGLKPSAWVLRLRLERAARLLEASGMSVTDVALQAGFENLSHFHRCFAKKYGQTPLRYRKAFRREAF